MSTNERNIRLFKLDPLDSRNYATWSIRMQIALAETKCKSLVLGTEVFPVPAPAETGAALETRQEEWNERNEFALHRIQMAVTDRELMRVAACANAKDAWDILKTAHRVDGAAGKMMVQRKLRDLRMEEGSSAQSYIEQFEDIVAEATTLDMDIIKTPEQLALQFLAGLPKSLENFSDIISLNSQESGKELTPKSVTTALLSHVRTKSSKLDNVPEEDTAMNVDKSKAACHHCGKKGHFKSECYDLHKIQT